MRNSNRGYSLIELLTVIALIATLIAMLFPIFGGPRERSRQSTCASNLKQIGLAMAMYAQDYDGLYPYGADPVDKLPNVWTGDEADQVKVMQPLQTVLLPYQKTNEIWRCPSDTGVETLRDQTDTNGDPIKIDALPTAFEKLGTSYVWRTELAFQHKFFATDGYRGKDSVGCAEITIVNEITGAWHGSKDLDGWMYEGLMGDGHVKHQTIAQNRQSWAISLDPQ